MRRAVVLVAVGIACASLSWATTRVVGGSSAEAGGTRGSEARVSPEGAPATIASGRANGRSWVLRGYRAQIDTAGRSRTGICLSLTERAEQSPQCFADVEAAVAEHGLVVEQRPVGEGLIFGEVPVAATAVMVRSEDRTVDEAVVVPAPKNLGVEVNFFAYATHGPGDLALEARDENGEVLAQETLTAYPVLVVERVGEGTGTVTSYHTDLLAVGADDAQVPWIDCGDLCSATLADARVTLRAVPAEGSIFSGWSGDCTGTGDCVLEVDSDANVTAHFDPAP